MKTLQNLSSLEDIKWANASKIVLVNTTEIPVQRNFDGYIREYYSEISKLRTTILTKNDMQNIKLFVSFYGYWFDQKKQTITMNNNIYDILKVKNNLYIKNKKTNDVENLQKYFKIARLLNGSKLATKLYEEI